MRAVTLIEPHRLELSQVPPPPASGPGEALVRVRRIGVCGTDLHAYRGHQPYFTYPRILGHEIAAEIVEAEGAGFGPGEAVVVMPHLWCGVCLACRQGKTNCCVRLQVLGVHVDGGLQDYIVVPQAALVRAEGLSLEQMALVENQSIGAHAVWRAGVVEGEWVLVIGAGPIGSGVTQFAKLAGARTIVMDVSEAKLDFARRWLQPDHCLKADDDALAALCDLTEGDFPSVVFDCTGSPASMMQAFNYPAHGGRLVLVSLVQADIAFSDPDFHKRELSVLSSRNATRQDFEQVIQAMAAGWIVTEPLTTHRARLEDVPAAFPEWLRPEAGVVKAMVEV